MPQTVPTHVTCSLCGGQAAHVIGYTKSAARCDECRGKRQRQEPLISWTTRYEDDPIAQRIVQRWGPLSRQEVGVMLGLSSEGVRIIETAALARVARALARAGISEADVISWLMRARTEHPLSGSMHAEADS